ncbi:MAG TPA: THUMP domain-containing protein [Thermoanaerobaculia bacterium]|jgi:thiamine biosynthesis protein ThiI|nr:THUMP domain-containing protein [Thermoanaerobaculia bacterium]
MSTYLLILRLSGDFYTKARRTRMRFFRRLVSNLEAALKAHGIPYKLEPTWSRLYLETPEPAAAEVLARVFGVQSVSQVERRSWETLEDLVATGVETFGEAVRGRSFAVRATRRGQRDRIGFDSTRIERELGRALLDAGAGRVNLSQPEVTAHVELEPGSAHLFFDKVRGHGGLPIGVEGRAVALVSGGFDSAVASWLMLKRGVQLDYVFCNLGGAAHRLGVLQVMKSIAERWSYGYTPRLHEVDLAPMVVDLREKVKPANWQIVLKRLILQAGGAVAHRGGRLALITGDAIGQVSSQTLQNLAVISQASPAMPVLRPLLGFNKEEILDLARRIGIYELSAAVPEYCDLMPPKPNTRAALRDVLRDEARLDPDLLNKLVDDRRIHDLRQVDPEALDTSVPEIDRIPDGATVIDLRSAPAYRGWHHAQALHLDLSHALAAYLSFSRDRPYVLVCEVGLKSAHLAEKMREAGFDAFQFQGGIRGLMALAEKEEGIAAALLAPAVRD